MGMLSADALFDLAVEVRQHCTRYIAKRGTVTDDEVRYVIRHHLARQVASDRSIEVIQGHLAEM